MRPKPAVGEIYHIYNRGVDKRTVFLENADYARFIHDLYEFNNNKPLRRWHSMSEVGLLTLDRMVELLAFCLMPNHYHLLIQEVQEGGITEFMRKLGTGYTNYFNQKHQRSGALFQGKYKVVRVSEDRYLRYLPYYIHLNPLDLIAPEWRDGEIADTAKAERFLESYRWSSYLDHTGKKNFPSVTQRKHLLEILGPPQEQIEQMIAWIKRNGWEEIEHLALE